MRNSSACVSVVVLDVVGYNRYNIAACVLTPCKRQNISSKRESVRQ